MGRFIVMLIWKIFRISGNQSNELGKMIGYGCGLVFAGQIVYSFLICLNIVPGNACHSSIFVIWRKWNAAFLYFDGTRAECLSV